MQRAMARLLVSVVAFLFTLCGLAEASPPYRGYIYDQAGREMVTPAAYDAVSAWHLFGDAGAMKEPHHLIVDKEGRIWVADTGNNRVLLLATNGSLLREIKAEVGESALNQPQGVFITATGDLLVADTGNQRVVRFDESGQFKRAYMRPESPLLGEGYKYAPIRVVEDRRGYLYVLNEGSSLGLMQLDPDGIFRGFFGANRVQFSWTRVFKNLFATEAQQERIVDEKPPVYTDVVIDGFGFIYTSTAQAENNQLKKLSPVGVDVLNRPDELPPTVYGEFTFTLNWGWWRRNLPNFTGLTVDRRGIMTAVDATTGRA